MMNYLVVHYEPDVPLEIVESRWSKLADERRASWLKTWHNLGIGKRYCWWDAPNEEILEQIFHDRRITWERITEVELTIPADWINRED